MESLETVREEYSKAVDELHAAAEAVESFDADAAQDEADFGLDELKSKFDEAEAKATELKDKVELYERTQKAREVAIPDVSEDSDVAVKSEALTYTKDSGNSIFRDMYRSTVSGDVAAQERLSRHSREMAERSQFDLSSTDSAGGYLVAPLYLQEEFVDYARAGSVVADVIGARPLPPNTDTVNIPTQDGGTAVATQSDNGAVQETDATFSTLAADVKTVAGMQDVSQQLLDRSVPGIDGVIYGDLTRALAVSYDTAVINSSTANNKGLLQVTGINSVTYTDGSPTASECLPKIADAIQQIATGIYAPATAVFMHPRRWAFFLAAQDSSNRPLISPVAPSNSPGTFGGNAAEGAVGSIQGLPVYTDANIPTNLGSGTNEDRIIVASVPDLYIWADQSGPYLETFRDVGSGTLTVRLRLHQYWAQAHARRPKAISVISGTGLATPSF
jgi:HK97 family phage major capsid protein